MNTYIGPGKGSPIDSADAREERPKRLAIVAGAFLAAVALFGYGVVGPSPDNTPVPSSSQPAGEGNTTFTGNIPYDPALAP